MVNGTEARAYDDDTTPDFGTVVHYTGLSPGIGGTRTLLLPDTDMRYVMLSVASWSLFHSGTSLGLPTSSVVNMYNNGTGFSGGPNGLHIPGTNRLKFVIAHEIGHVVGGIRDGNTGPNFDYSAGADGGCPVGGTAHTRHSKEFQSAVAVEGWASFFSESMWNSGLESDCVYDNQFLTDWDLDGTSDDTVGTGIPVAGYMNCEGIPVPGVASWVTARDYLSDMVDAADPAGCGGTKVNRGTEYDWMRFFWDMRTDEGVVLSTLVDLYDDMNPHTWDENGGTTTTSDDPTARLSSAASGLGTTVYNAYLAQKNDGVDH
jgi:hypothetical protein